MSLRIKTNSRPMAVHGRQHIEPLSRKDWRELRRKWREERKHGK